MIRQPSIAEPSLALSQLVFPYKAQLWLLSCTFSTWMQPFSTWRVPAVQAFYSNAYAIPDTSWVSVYPTQPQPFMWQVQALPGCLLAVGCWQAPPQPVAWLPLALLL